MLILRKKRRKQKKKKKMGGIRGGVNTRLYGMNSLFQCQIFYNTKCCASEEKNISPRHITADSIATYQPAHITL